MVEQLSQKQQEIGALIILFFIAVASAIILAKKLFPWFLIAESLFLTYWLLGCNQVSEFFVWFPLNVFKIVVYLKMIKLSGFLVFYWR